MVRAARVLYGGFDNWTVKGVRNLRQGTPAGGLTAEVIILNTDTREMLRLEGAWDGEMWVDRILSKDTDSDRTDAAKKGSKNKGRAQPKCTKGRPCGGSCIRRKTASGKDTSCRNKPEGVVKEALNKASETPKAPSKGKPAASGGGGTSGAAPKNVVAFESEIVDLPKEKAGLFKRGRKIFEKGGTSDTVVFNMGELGKMAGGILTHNHPTNEESRLGTSLSYPDISLAVGQRLAEIRAVSGEYVYSLKPNGVEYDKSFGKFIEATHNKIVKKYGKRLDAAFNDSTTEDELNNLVSMANFESSHEIAATIANEYGMIYERQRLRA